MVLHDCPECGRVRGAVLRDTDDGEAFLCLGCGNRVSGEDVVAPGDERLTDRDRTALGG